MREELVPAFVAVQIEQSQEGFIAFEAPVLAGELEAALVLRAGGFYGSRSDRLAEFPACFVIHAFFGSVKIADLQFNGFLLRSGELVKCCPQPFQSLPMTVIRRLDALLEPTKDAVLRMKEHLDKAKVAN